MCSPKLLTYLKILIIPRFPSRSLSPTTPTPSLSYPPLSHSLPTTPESNILPILLVPYTPSTLTPLSMDTFSEILICTCSFPSS